MSIPFKAVTKTQVGVKGGGKKQYCAIATSKRLIDTKHLKEILKKEYGIQPSNTVQVLEGLLGVLRNHIPDGSSIQLGDLGIISVHLSSKLVDAPEKVDYRTIKRASIAFRPSNEVKEILHSVSFKRVKSSTR